jgi:hypothetical protein
MYVSISPQWPIAGLSIFPTVYYIISGIYLLRTLSGNDKTQMNSFKNILAQWFIIHEGETAIGLAQADVVVGKL